VLMRYLKENVAERALRKAQEAFDHKEYQACRALLELVDVPRIEKLESFLGSSGALLSPAAHQHYNKLKQSLLQVLTIIITGIFYRIISLRVIRSHLLPPSLHSRLPRRRQPQHP